MNPKDMPEQDYSHHIWWKILLGLNIFFVFFGISSACLGMLPPASVWRQLIAAHFYGGNMSEDVRTLYDFMRGPLGGTMAGSYLLQTFIVAIPLRRGEPWAWWAIMLATGLWFVIDSSVSAMHGAWFNVLYVNSFALIVMSGATIAFWKTTEFKLKKT